MNRHSQEDALPASPAPRPARRIAARRPRPDAAPRTDKGEAILRAAITVFARRGFFNAQVADVAREAKVAAGTVYLYFQNKDHLLVSIFQRTMREALQEGRAVLDGVSDPVERLRTIARVHLERVGRDRDLAVVTQVELRQSTKFLEQFSITERLKVNLRASSFNLANHPVFSGPNTTFGALGQFGRISGQANLSRQTEVVLRVIF